MEDQIRHWEIVVEEEVLAQKMSDGPQMEIAIKSKTIYLVKLQYTKYAPYILKKSICVREKIKYVEIRSGVEKVKKCLQG